MFDKVLNSQALKICIIAAPGSGKTKRALIPKIKQILDDPDIDPKKVLLLTFSRLSAKDLKERVGLMERAPKASTVHSLCLAFLLSENSHSIRKRVESIVLDFEKNALISDIKLLFPKIPKPKLKKALSKFSAGWATQPHDKVFEESDLHRAFKTAVTNWLSEYEAVIMEEIVYEAVNLAKQLGSPEFIQSPQYIFVDEYQDLNKLEQEFIELLAADSKLLLVVGDPDQSIYSFKYSYPTGIKDFASQSDVEDYYSYDTGRCPKKVVEIANQLLLQADPARTDLLKSIREDDGEVNFIQKENQIQEFEYILNSISKRLQEGAKPQNIILLVPKKPLGTQFVKYALSYQEKMGIPNEVKFKFDSRTEISDLEQEGIILMGMLVRNNSMLGVRSYLALGDKEGNAKELKLLKDKYGNILDVLSKADINDFPSKNTRVKKLIGRVILLRNFLAIDRKDFDITKVLNELFPVSKDETKSIRAIIDELKETEDTLETLYLKLIDHLRTVATSPFDIRVMTLMGSKGLEAEHVYILGCNSGNIPGTNRSSHLSVSQHREEQRRFLFVGVTRASKSLTISWARLIPFSQSKQHHTRGLRSVKQQGVPTQTLLGISEFLEDLRGITWQK